MEETKIFEELNGEIKAAILFGIMPLEETKEIAKNLNNSAKEILIRTMATMGKFEEKIIKKTVIEFLENVKSSEFKNDDYSLKATEELIKEYKVIVKGKGEKTKEYIDKMIDEKKEKRKTKINLE